MDQAIPRTIYILASFLRTGETVHPVDAKRLSSTSLIYRTRSLTLCRRLMRRQTPCSIFSNAAVNVLTLGF